MAVLTRSTYLTVNSVPLATPAWRVLDLSPLYGRMMRGQVERMPYVDGAVGFRHRIDYRSVTLPIDVYGRYTSDGATISDVHAGLDDNIDYLLTNVVEPGTDAVPATWHRATGDVLTADVFVESFEPTRWGRGMVRFGLELSIPAGRFA